MNPNAENSEKIRIINKYRPIIAKRCKLKEEEVFAMTCHKHKIKMKIGEHGWYCEKCKEGANE